MKMHLAWLVLAVAWSTASMAQAPAKEPKIPKNKWMDGSRDYEEAKELQKATGADMVVYFSRSDAKDEKGLCSWWENQGIQSGQLGRLLESYVKVRVELPFRNNKIEEQFKAFRFNKTPAVFVVKPDGFPQRVQVFDWPGGKPDLHDPDKLVELFKERSSPKKEVAPAQAESGPK